MEFETIIFEEREGAFRLILNRPEQLNCVNARMQAEIFCALDIVESSNPRVLLITGVGRGFCAGQDLSERDEKSETLDLSRGPEEFYNPLVRRLAALPAPVVGAVNGAAAGAGVNIAIACDIVVAKKSAKFVQAFSSIGLVPDAGATWHLPRLMGQGRALAFSLLGERLSADQAQDLGLVWKVIEDEQFESEVDAMVDKLSKSPTVGLASTKMAIVHLR